MMSGNCSFGNMSAAPFLFQKAVVIFSLSLLATDDAGVCQQRTCQKGCCGCVSLYAHCDFFANDIPE